LAPPSRVAARAVGARDSYHGAASMSDCLAVVLAAGQGTRMKSDLPKVLVPVCGRPMVEYVLDTLAASQINKVAMVVGYQAERVMDVIGHPDGLVYVHQAERRGTGHAVMVCRDLLVTHRGPVLVVAGDSPMLRSDSVNRLLETFHRGKYACLLGTARKENPHGLGRIVRDERGALVKIVEEKDATEAQRAIQEVNLSCYVFDSQELVWALDRLKPDNAQAEYYLTDCPGILKANGRLVEAACVLTAAEALSINNVDELVAVEEAMQAMARA
jgi:bifunctional UDP-N-acetylglucosamine pyrophosphorylase/glucosamine-1-phosphate N-acetyltransferase/UDP-N-acetylglucosamine pyrophosphorylase